MSKKILSISLMVVILIQLIFPVYAIVNATQAQNSGEVYKFKVLSIHYDNSVIDCNIDLIGMYEDFDFDEDYGPNKYVIVTKDENGFANITTSKEKPKTSNYITRKAYDFNYNICNNHSYKFNNINYAFLLNSKNKNASSIVTKDGTEHNVQITDLYLEAKIYNGKLLVLEYYVNGITLESFLDDYEYA